MPISNLVKQGGGTDFHAYTPFFNTYTNLTTSYVTFLDVTGKGILTGVTLEYTTATFLEVRITVDGLVRTTNFMITSNTNLDSLIPFKTSLKVEVKATINSSSLKTMITYLLA